MVNVTKENFIEQSNDLLRHLPTATFVAIDEEMTGISVSTGRRPQKDLTPCQRYYELKQAPERYSIIQFGISLFHRRDETAASTNSSGGQKRGYSTATTTTSAGSSSSSLPQYTVRRYNFYMFPSSTEGQRHNNNNPDKNENNHEVREVVLNPSTVQFLHEHNMDFDMWSKYGVNYTTSPHAHFLLRIYETQQIYEMEQEENRRNIRPTTNSTTTGTGTGGGTFFNDIRHGGRVELRRTEDIDFYAKAMASLREWLDAPFSNNNNNVGQGEGDDDENTNENHHHFDDEGSCFLLPSCNAFMRRALYESIEQEYPTLETDNAGGGRIRVMRMNEEERGRRHHRLHKEGWEKLISKQIGMYRIFDALHRVCSGKEIRRDSILFADSYDQIDWDNIRNRKKTEDDEEEKDSSERLQTGRRMIPLVVHNGFMDICFLLTHFHSHKLPESYQGCKELISSYFPIIYDTKVLSTESNCWGANGTEHNAHSTNLSNLFNLTVLEGMNEDAAPVSTQLHVAATGGGGIVVQDQEHEAAYDAYMTGCVYIGLCRRIMHFSPLAPDFHDAIGKRDSQECQFYYHRNRLYQFSLFTMDLETPRPNYDPMSRGMLPETTFRVANIDRSVTTRDVVECLSNPRDSVGRDIYYQIIWLNDQAFVCATVYSAVKMSSPDRVDAAEIVLREHGAVIFRALKSRFQKGSIVILENYLRWSDPARCASQIERLQQEEEEQQRKEEPWTDRLLSFFGLTTTERARQNVESAVSNKRRRVN